MAVAEPLEPSERERKTYRYLRIAMVLMAAGLGASVLYERINAAEDCWQRSISAYYYTPVQGFFVAALVTIGICLIALKSATDHEDIVLNLAGACAPFVAFIPTPTSNLCGERIVSSGDRDLYIGNNVTALLVIAGLTLVVSAALARGGKDRSDRQRSPVRGRMARVATAPSKADRIGYGIAVLLFVVTTCVFLFQRKLFIERGHLAAAVVMFVFIAIVVLFNAREAKEPPLRRVYGAVLAGMIISALGNGIAGLAGWSYWVLSIEACLIALFAVFWVVQTLELWNQGVRESQLPATPPGEDGPPEPSV